MPKSVTAPTSTWVPDRGKPSKVPMNIIEATLIWVAKAVIGLSLTRFNPTDFMTLLPSISKPKIIPIPPTTLPVGDLDVAWR